MLRDLLRPIENEALRLKLIAGEDAKELQRRAPVHRANDRQRSSGSGLIIASTSASLCALCGVALHLESPSEKSRQFTTDEKEKSDDIDVPAKKKREIIPKEESVDMSKELRSMLVHVRRSSSDKIDCQICHAKCQHGNEIRTMKFADDHTVETSSVSKNPLGCNINTVTSKPIKLIQQNSRTTYASSMTPRTQDASTLTHDTFCPCACGLLMEDESKGGLSIESLSTLKEKLIKTKLEEFGFYRDSKERSIKTHSDVKRSRKTEMHKWRIEKSVESSVNDEITRLKLHAQAKELHRNIQFIKEQNEYLRHFVKKRHYSSEKTKILLPLPIEATYSRFTAAIEFLRARYRSGNGIMAALTDTLRGSINVQWITERLLAPFVQR